MMLLICCSLYHLYGKFDYYVTHTTLHYTTMMGSLTPLQRCLRLLLVVLVAIALTGDGSNCCVQAFTFTSSSASTTLLPRSHHHSILAKSSSASFRSNSNSNINSNSRSLTWTPALSAANSQEEDIELTRQTIFQHQDSQEEKETTKKKKSLVRKFFSLCASPYRRLKSYLHLHICVPKKPKP
jgi:hypothetical protein